METKSTKELLEILQKTDSLSKKNKVNDILSERGSKYLDNILECSESFGEFNDYAGKYLKEFLGHPTYLLKGSGSCEISKRGEDKININYKDYWSYGGECDEDYGVSLSNFDNFNKEKFKAKISKYIKKTLKEEIMRATATLKELSDKEERFNQQ